MKFLLIAFNFLIFIKFTLSCSSLTNLGDMAPVEQILLVNSDIIISCTLNPTSKYNISDVIFTLHDEIIDQKHVQIINEQTAQLTIRNASQSDSGRYYCKVRDGDRLPLVCVSYATVGYKPDEMFVKDFSCIFHYRNEMRCFWTKPDNKIETSYRVNEIVYGVTGFDYPCGMLQETKIGPDTKFTCIWNKSTNPRSNVRDKYHYIITGKNPFGQHEMAFTFNLSSIVQLDPPLNLTFDNDSNILSWDYPSFIYKEYDLFRLLKFKILINNDDNTQIMYLDNTERSVKLDKLKPYTWYNFSISCKIDDPLNDHWSDFSSITSRTKEDVPESPPNLIYQAFETTSITPRSATIYWETLTDRLKNGPLISYLIICINSESNMQTNITTAYTKQTFDNLSSFPYEFRVYSKNLMGLSKEYSKIILPATDDVLRAPNKITVYVNSNLYELRWEKSNVDYLQNYTVFWCIAKNDYCTSDINWRFVTQNHYTLNLSHENYKFGVSANTQNSSSGISWTKCIVNSKTKVDKLHAWAFKQGSSSILLKWNFLCDAQKKLVRDLRIQYCPKDNCQNENKKSEIVQNSNNEVYLVENLDANTTYKFTISSSNIAEESTFSETTDVGTPFNPTDLKIISSNNYSSVIQWSFASDMLEHFKIDADFLHESFNMSSKLCEGFICLNNLTYKQPLKAFTDYSIYVSSCNINGDCSNPSSVTFKTDASKPGKMFLPKTDKLGPLKYRFFLEHPRDSNGPIDYYYVQQANKPPERYNGTQEYVDINVVCENYLSPEIYKVSFFASNIVNGEELKSEPNDWTSLDICKGITKTYIIIIICGIISIILIILASLYGFGMMNNLKTKKKAFQINVKCNKEQFDLTEKDNLVQKEDDMKPEIIEKRKISLSLTNGSIHSDSSSPENSHLSDKNASPSSSSSDNCYNSDSTVNYNDLNYRENHEYFINNLEECSKPLMSNSGPEEKPQKLDMGNATELNKSFSYVSPTSSQLVQKPVTNSYVPLSPIANSNSQYVPHSFVASQNIKNSTNV